MIEVQTVLELAKDTPPWIVAKKTGYTTAQVKQMLKQNNQQPFGKPRGWHGIPRISGERRQVLLDKIRSIVAYKKFEGLGTANALAEMGINMGAMQVNRWIRKFKASGEL